MGRHLSRLFLVNIVGVNYEVIVVNKKTDEAAFIKGKP